VEVETSRYIICLVVLAVGTNMYINRDGSGTCMAVGLDKIEFLQNHENHEIYQKAFDIIEQYFGSEEEEDRSIAPSAGDQQFNFAADMPDAVQSSGFQF